MGLIDTRVGPSTLPATDLFAVTPSDTNDLLVLTRGLYVGVSGDVKVTCMAGNVTTLVGLAAGVFHPIRVRRVWATGTTATNIVGAA